MRNLFLKIGSYFIIFGIYIPLFYGVSVLLEKNIILGISSILIISGFSIIVVSTKKQK